MRRARSGGWSLVELLAALAIFGSFVLAAGALVAEVSRSAEAARRRCAVLELRWETVRRLRADCAAARDARVDDGGRVLVRTGPRGEVRWRTGPGGLARAAESAPPLRPSTAAGRFELRRAAGGGALVDYEIVDVIGAAAGGARVGGRP
jgi:prepilin-type N-terminal cleavage/methylation domain-containing protein